MPVRGLRRLFVLVARPFRGRRAVDLEIGFHLDQVIADLERRGLGPSAARDEAYRRFGDVGRYREALVTIDRASARRRNRRERFGALFQDLSLVVRGLIRSPGFVAGVGLTLAIGIGINVTMIGLVDRLLFQPPAHVADPDRVVRYTLTQTVEPFGTFTNTSVSGNDLLLVQDKMRSTEAAAPYFAGTLSLGRGESARKIKGMIAGAGYFRLLGVRPALGRFFAPDEDPVGGGAPIAVISYRLWQRQWGGRPDALGKQLWLGSRQYTIVGVAPNRFTGIDLDAVDVWLPFNTGAAEFGGRGEWRTWNWQWLKIVARLKPEVTRAAAGAEATALYRAAVADDPNRKNDHGTITYQPVIGARGASEDKEPAIAALLAGVSVLVLLITCANVANLVLARGLARRREIAVRVALGVGKGRLVRMLLSESLLLAVLGALGGVGIAYCGGLLIRRWLLPGIDFVEPPVDLRLGVVTFGIAVFTGVLIGLVPAFQLSRPDLTEDLKAGGASAQGSAGRRHVRLRNMLLFTQGTISAVMLIGAGLFARSLFQVNAVDFGFRPERLLVAEVPLDVLGYTKEQRVAFYDEAYRRFQSVPGFASVSLATANPFWTRYSTSVRAPGRDSVARLKSGGPYYTAVTAEYFDTMGIPILRGRGFSEADRDGAPYVMVVNETLAKTFWPGEDPTTKCLYVGKETQQCRQVVGVARDASSESLELEPVQAYYVPLGQSKGLTNDRTLFFRAAGDPQDMIGTVRKTIQGLRADLPWVSVRLLQDQIDPLIRPWRLAASLFGVMGVVALGVVLIGLYSVLSYTVVQRTREFGIRTALGASVREVITMVVGEGQRVIGLAVILGATVFLVFGTMLRSMLFHTSPRDPWVYGGVAIVLVAANLVGSLLPAWRAARVEPMAALRGE